MRIRDSGLPRRTCVWESGGWILLLFLLAGCGKREASPPDNSSGTVAGRQDAAPSARTKAPKLLPGAESDNPLKRSETPAASVSIPATNTQSGAAVSAMQEKAVNLYNLGVQHFQGDGVPKSASEAARYFQQAAELGHPGAEHNLGVLYLAGSGVTNDASEAAKWLGKSADHGLPEAQFKLASLYATGLGVTQDLAQAAQWARKAAEQGHAEAEYNLATLYASGKGVEQDFAQAAHWFRRAAEKGKVTAQSNLGVLYAKGQGVPQNPDEAIKWFRKAAEQGHPSAQYNLARAYFEGKVVAKDCVEAYKWFLLAAEQGDGDAAKARLDVSQEISPSQIAEAIRRANAFTAQLQANRTNQMPSVQTNLIGVQEPKASEKRSDVP
ncbi:MAG: sel1 repeat family protein [Verrucomicrobia bacterium]|nr:sel1 repeat family protein [Verrucomicrobiota bacterium]